MPEKQKWVGTWATAPAPAEGAVAFNNQTLRMTCAPASAATRLRVRISNAYGSRPLAIGARAYRAARQGAGDRCRLRPPAHLRRRRAATIAAGARAVQRPGRRSTCRRSPISRSASICPARSPADFQITGRYARQTNYISPPGDFTAATVMPVGSLTDEWFFVCGVDVLAPPRPAASSRSATR